MEVFGIGLPELALIMIVILLVFGPEQLPEIAKKLGHATRDLRRSLNDINSEVNENIQPLKELKDFNPFTIADSKPDSNLIVADDAEIRPSPPAAEDPVTPAAPVADPNAPAEPPMPPESSEPEDLSTPM